MKTIIRTMTALAPASAGPSTTEAAAGFNLSGWGARYNEPAAIDSDWEGSFTETLLPGTFADSLRASLPVLLWDHGRSALLGTLPLGVVRSAVEHPQGLWVEATMSDSWAVQPVRQAITDQAVRGMSVRMQVLADRWTRGPDGGQLRSISKALLLEVSPVTWAAYEGTSVNVRADPKAPVDARQRRTADSTAAVRRWENDMAARARRQRQDHDTLRLLGIIRR